MLRVVTPIRIFRLLIRTTMNATRYGDRTNHTFLILRYTKAHANDPVPAFLPPGDHACVDRRNEKRVLWAVMKMGAPRTKAMKGKTRPTTTEIEGKKDSRY